jgi:hypothetical protein
MEATMSKLEDAFLGEAVLVDNNPPDYRELNSQVATAFAEKNDMFVVYPTDKQLFIDIDSDQAYELFLNQLQLLKKIESPIDYTETVSKSGLPHRHIVVNLVNPKDIGTRVALQASMGSDRRCELLRLVRIHDGDPNPILFLEKKCD